LKRKYDKKDEHDVEELKIRDETKKNILRAIRYQD